MNEVSENVAVELAAQRIDEIESVRVYNMIQLADKDQDHKVTQEWVQWPELVTQIALQYNIAISYIVSKAVVMFCFVLSMIQDFQRDCLIPSH